LKKLGSRLNCAKMQSLSGTLNVPNIPRIWLRRKRNLFSIFVFPLPSGKSSDVWFIMTKSWNGDYSLEKRPEPQDDEMADFRLVNLNEEKYSIFGQVEKWKPNCMAISLDFALRHSVKRRLHFVCQIWAISYDSRKWISRGWMEWMSFNSSQTRNFWSRRSSWHIEMEKTY